MPPGEDIEQLFLDVALFSKGLSILNFSYPICEVDLPKFSSVEEGKEVGVGPAGRPAGAQREVDRSLQPPSRRPDQRLGSPPWVDKLSLMDRHMLCKNDHTAHRTGPALQASVDIK